MQTKKYITVLFIDLFIVDTPPFLVVILAILTTLPLITQVMTLTTLIRTRQSQNLIGL